MKGALLAILCFAGGAYCWWTVMNGIKRGKIDPLSRGWPGEIERIDYPRGFWVAVCWNALIGLIALWSAIGIALGL
jgi:hypothetical protein